MTNKLTPASYVIRGLCTTHVLLKAACNVFVAALIALGTTYSYADTLSRVKQNGEINLGYVADAAPFSSSDANGQPQGYSVDLCREVAEGVKQQLGLTTLKVNWVSLTVQNRLEAVRSGRVDIECSTTTWTFNRQREVDFSLITFVDGASAIANSASDIFRFTDFAGKRIAVIPGTTTESALKGALNRRSMSGTVVPVANRLEGLRLLSQGEVEGFASDRVVLIALSMRETGKVKVLDDDFSVEQYALALPRGDYEFRLLVNKVLARLYRTGDILNIYNRWLGGMGQPSILLHAAYYLQSVAE